MADLVRRIPGARAARETTLPEIEREWIVTNGLGGYASGNVAGANTRRYHGLLIAALPAPVGRVVMLNQITERKARANPRFMLIARCDKVRWRNTLVAKLAA